MILTSWILEFKSGFWQQCFTNKSKRKYWKTTNVS